ncbi:DUF2997 domain-containing protein [Methanobacterium movens]
MGKKINIRIYPDGRVQADVEGIKGKSCTDYIKILEEILNAETVDSEYTSEYYESENLILENESKEKIRRIN